MALFIATPGCSLFGALLLVLYFTENTLKTARCNTLEINTSHKIHDLPLYILLEML